MKYEVKQKEINDLFDKLIADIEIQRASSLWHNSDVTISFVKKEGELSRIIAYRIEQKEK